MSSRLRLSRQGVTPAIPVTSQQAGLCHPGHGSAGKCRANPATWLSRCRANQDMLFSRQVLCHPGHMSAGRCRAIPATGQQAGVAPHPIMAR